MDFHEIFDLFIELDANDEQANFPLIYACAKEGYAHLENKLEQGNFLEYSLFCPMALFRQIAFKPLQFEDSVHDVRQQ